jgi:O-antigen/teichoic acid export membrane protein
MVKEGEGENQTRGGKILRNFGWLTAGRALGDGFTFLLLIVLSRVFGQDGLGQYAFAVALTSFFGIFADFGLYNFSIKELSRCTGQVGGQYSAIFSLRLLLSVIVFGVLLFILPFLPLPRGTKLIIALLGAYQMLYLLVNGFAAVLVAREDMHLASLLEASCKASAALAAIAVAIAGGSFVMAMAALPAVAFAQFFVAYGVLTSKHGRPRLIASWSSPTAALRSATPYALSALLGQLHWRTDVVLLGFFLGAAASGLYSAAYRVVSLLTLLPHLAGMALFPLASRLYVNSRQEFEALYQTSVNLAILIGLPAAAGLWLIAPDLIDLLFGAGFAESAALLRLLAVLLLIGSLESILWVLLMSCDRQVKVTRIQWIVAWVNVVGNLSLIPLWGLQGAAISAVTSDMLFVILLGRQLGAVCGWPQVSSRLAIGGVATASFCLPLAFLPSLSMGVMIPASFFLYAGALLLFKEIRNNEVSLLVTLIKGKSAEAASIGKEVSS